MNFNIENTATGKITNNLYKYFQNLCYDKNGEQVDLNYILLNQNLYGLLIDIYNLGFDDGTLNGLKNFKGKENEFEKKILLTILEKNTSIDKIVDKFVLSNNYILKK